MNPRSWFSARRARLRATESLGPLTAAITLLAAVTYDAVADVNAGPIVCPLRRLTGAPCPSCGLTRSFVSLGNGDLDGALAAHPIGLALAAAMVLWIVAWAVALIRNRPLTAGPVARAIAWALAAGFAIVGLQRACG